MDLSQYALEDKVAVITGGSRGIGKATSLAFASAGAHVVVTSRKLADCEEVADEVGPRRKALAVSAHVGRMEQLQPVVDQHRRRVRPHRRAGQQRRHQLLLARDRDGREGLGLGDEHQPQGPLLPVAGRGARDEGAAAAARSSTWRRSPACGRRCPTAHYSIAKAGVIMADQGARGRVGAVRHPRQLRGARRDRHQALRRHLLADAARRSRTAQGGGRRRASRSSGSAQPREIADAILFFASEGRELHHRSDLTVDGGALWSERPGLGEARSRSARRTCAGWERPADRRGSYSGRAAPRRPAVLASGSVSTGARRHDPSTGSPRAWSATCRRPGRASPTAARGAVTSKRASRTCGAACADCGASGTRRNRGRGPRARARRARARARLSWCGACASAAPP